MPLVPVHRLLILAIALWLVIPRLALAVGEPEYVDAPDADTPRRAVEHFLDAVHGDRLEEATTFLALRPELASQAPRYAQLLSAVLDSQISAEPDWLGRISDLPLGVTSDGLPPDMEDIGRVRGPRTTEPVRMRREASHGTTGQAGGPDVRWLFTEASVQRSVIWHSLLSDVWLRQRLPARLLRHGPFGLLIWEWLALPIFLVVSMALGVLLTSLFAWFLRPLIRRMRRHNLPLATLRRPMYLVCSGILLGSVIPYLLITAQSERFMVRLSHVGVFWGLFWAAWKFVELVVSAIRQSAWLRSHPAALGVLPLGYRLAEVTVVIIALILALGELGYPVTSLVAGLGIGGLALALAAQKTVEHLFGGVMISLDQPMRIGDLVIVDGRQGWVEHIGLRSTSIRTLDRSLLTIPNGKLADLPIESLAARDNMRLQLLLGVTYDLTADRLDALRTRLLAYLHAHPKRWPGQQVRCHFVAFGSSSLDIEIMAWFAESDWDSFLELRHHVMIDLMRILEAAGAQIAFPTRTVHMHTAQK